MKNKNNYEDIKNFVLQEIKNNIFELQEIRLLNINKSTNIIELNNTCENINSISANLKTLLFDLVQLGINQHKYLKWHEYEDSAPDINLTGDQLLKLDSRTSDKITIKYWYIEDLSVFDTANKLVDAILKEISETLKYYYDCLDNDIEFVKRNRLFKKTEFEENSIKELKKKDLKTAYVNQTFDDLLWLLSLVNYPGYETPYNNQLNKYDYSLELVYTIKEAAGLWKKDTGNLRREFLKSNNESKFRPYEIRKSGGTWIIKKSAMERVYGKL